MQLILFSILGINIYYLFTHFRKREVNLYVFYCLYSTLFFLTGGLISTTEMFVNPKFIGSNIISEKNILIFQLSVCLFYIIFYLCCLIKRRRTNIVRINLNTTTNGIAGIFLFCFGLILINLILNFSESFIMVMLGLSQNTLVEARRYISNHSVGSINQIIYLFCPLFYAYFYYSKSFVFMQRIVFVALSLFLLIFLSVKFQIMTFVIMILLLNISRKGLSYRQYGYGLICISLLFIVTYSYNYHNIAFNIEWMQLLYVPLLGRLCSESFLMLYSLEMFNSPLYFTDIGSLGSLVSQKMILFGFADYESNMVTSVFGEAYIRFGMLGIVLAIIVMNVGIRYLSEIMKNIDTNSIYIKSALFVISGNIFYVFSGQFSNLIGVYLFFFAYFMLPYLLLNIYPIKRNNLNYIFSCILFLLAFYYAQGFVKGIIYRFILDVSSAPV